MFAPDLEGQILDTRNIDISHHLAVFVSQVFYLLDYLRHGTGVKYIRHLQLHDLILGEIEGHGPGKCIRLKYDLTTEYGRKHHHPKGYKGLGLRVLITQSHVPKSLMEPFVYLHPRLDPRFRIEIVLAVK